MSELSVEAMRLVQSGNIGQYLLDNAKFLDEMHHKLKGEALIEELQEINGQKTLIPVWKPVPGLEPFMKEFGINITMRVLSMSLTANNATGKMDDEVLRTLAFKTYVLLVKEYHIHKRECGFDDMAELYEVAHLIFTNVLLHLSKSTDMALLKELFSSYNIHEIRGDKGQQGQDRPTAMTI